MSGSDRKASYPLQPSEQFADITMSLSQSCHVRGHTLLVLDIDPASGQAEAAHQLLVAVPGCQVERVEAVDVGDVHSAAEGTERLSQAQEAFPGSDVDRRITGSVGLKIKIMSP